jgi:hypothetical protein
MSPTLTTLPVEQNGSVARLEVADQRLLETLDPESLRKYFTLTEADLQEVAVCHGAVNKLGFAVQLCALRWQGYSPSRERRNGQQASWCRYRRSNS